MPNKLRLKNGIIYQYLQFKPKKEKRIFSGQITASGKGKLVIRTSTCLQPPNDGSGGGKPFTHSIKKEIGSFDLNEKSSTFKFKSEIAPYEVGYIYINAKGEAVISNINGVVAKKER